jgi:hypothetical protein
MIRLQKGRHATIAAMSDDSSIVPFNRSEPTEIPAVLWCDEGGELRKLYDRHCAAAGARLRIAERERLARQRGVKVIRPELRVVDEPDGSTPGAT